jgi:RimJ/RimL family protein N-acetyltransferase
MGANDEFAQTLYRTVGFQHEGTQRNGWCLDGKYFDVHHMARLQ